ncbi:MAG: hydrogenase maturation nickel metallochaperone HypA [bacterium]
MHELGIAQSIVDIVLRTVMQNGGGKIATVRIQAGEMRSIIADQLTFCFAFAAKDTPVEGARLEVEVLPIEALCEDCRQEFRVRGFRFQCPECRGASVRVLRGQELRVKEIELQ